MTKYIAVGSVGHFMPGDEIEGLNPERIQALLNCGAIKEADPIAETHDAPDPKVLDLEKQVETLKVEKAESEKQVETLKVEVAALKKAVADAEKKTKAEAKTEK